MGINYCYRCLEPMEDGRWICPHCGHDNRQRNNDEGLLPEGTILNGKYLVGRALGRGGFGVTYLGLELTLKIKVAVKEYFPAGICSRPTNTRTVKISNIPANSEGFERGKKAFQKEAETLAMFSSPSIAHVRDYFLENNTAYIVMDYVEGIELGAEIRRCGGRMPWRRVVDLMLPLISEMGRLHRKNLVHRDIKPANIRIVRDEDTGAEHLVLLDFGAARSYTSSNVTKTYTQILTPGFAPFEQYQARTHLGPYTDIYALCATMYAAITGEKPPAAPDRITGEDQPKPFSSYGLDVPDQVEKAIFHGMAVDYHDRPQTMETLWREFQDRPVEPADAIRNANTSGNDQTLRAADMDLQTKLAAGSQAGPAPSAKPGKKSKTVLAAALGVLLAAAAFFLFFRSNIIKFPANILLPTDTDVPTDTPTPFPTSTPEPTAVDINCNSYLTYLDDVTVPDGTIFVPGDEIVKTWSVRNDGDCTWNEKYTLRYIDGSAMEAKQNQALPKLAPGEEGEVTVVFTAPQTVGSYYSGWQAYDPQGKPFGDDIYMEIYVDPYHTVDETQEESGFEQ